MNDPRVLMERLAILNKLNQNLSTFLEPHKYEDFINYNNSLIDHTVHELELINVYVNREYM